MSMQPKVWRKAKRRGSAMLITIILSLAMASVVMYAVSDTMSANKSAQREDNYARALAAAEYGAELAITEIGKDLIKDGDNDTSLVLGDFVVGENNGAKTLFRDKTRQAVEQRRIAGKFDNQDFRVRVRSARQVYGHPDDTLAEDLIRRGWLSAPENAEIPLGEIRAYQFQDIYEITSSAQDARITHLDNVSSEYHTRPVIQAVVKYDYASPLDDLLNKLGVIHQEDAARMQVSGGYNQQVDWDGIGNKRHEYFGNAAYTAADYETVGVGEAPMKAVYNLAVSGEDHNLVKRFVSSVVANRIIVPWKLKTNEQQYFGARSGFWNGGSLTLNYRHPDNREAEDNVLNLNNAAKGWVRKTANPYRPASYKVGADDIDRDMWIRDETNPVYDSYLLGGKTSGSGAGLSITLDEAAPGVTTGVKGRIAETKVEMHQAPYQIKYKSPSKGGAFKIVLGAYEDLRNLYIAREGDLNNHKAGHQVYVGQYTKDARVSAMMVDNTLPLYQGSKVRPQTVQTVRNAENQILVRLYERVEDGKKVYYKYPHLDSYEFDVMPTMSVGMLNKGMIVPSAEALKELDYLIQNNLDTNITEAILAQTSPDLSKAWARDKEGNWYYGGNYSSYTFVTVDANGDRRAYWLKYDLVNRKLLYTLDKSKPDAESTAVTKTSYFKYYFYNIAFTPSDRVIQSGSKWTGYYVWAHGGYHCFVNGSDFTAIHQGQRKNFRMALDKDGSKTSSGFVLYGNMYGFGNMNPDLDMLVPPEREEEETDEQFAKRTADYEAKKALYTKRLEGVIQATMGRPFLWQELIGYSVAKRGDSKENTTHLNEPDVIGNNVKAGADKDDMRTYFRLVDGQRVPVGFDELYQAINPQTLQWETHPLAGKYPGDNLADPVDPVNNYLQDRHDPIRVFEPANANWEKGRLADYGKPVDETNTEDIKAYYTMDDFLYDVDFGKDEYGNPIIRKAVNILVGYEDQITAGSDYDYGDLMFTIYIAPEVKGSTSVDIVSGSAQQWWERDEREGLTGRLSHMPVTVNDNSLLNPAPVPGAPTQSILAANFQRLGCLANLADEKEISDLKSQFWSMRDLDPGKYTTFPRATFTFVDGYSNGKLDASPKEARAWIEECEKLGVKAPFYFTEDDLIDSVQWVLADQKSYDEHGEDYFDKLTGKIKRDVVIKKILDDNQDYDLQYIDYRWYKEEVNPDADPEAAGEPAKIRVRLKNRTEMTADAPSSLAVTQDEILVRRIASHVVGSETLSVLGVKTREYSPIPMEDGTIKPVETAKAFLPGEPRLAYDAATPLNGNHPYDGGDQPATIQTRQDEMAFTDLDGTGKPRKGKVLDFLADDPSLAVKKMYSDYFDVNARKLDGSTFHAGTDIFRDLENRAKMWKKYGMKDKRFVIGYHRGGNDPKFLENVPGASESSYLQDRYEVVSLGKLGWNPYRSTRQDGGEASFLADNLQPKTSPDSPDTFAYEFKYGTANIPGNTVCPYPDTPEKLEDYFRLESGKYGSEDGSGVPNFLFDQPIDGAGAMVVNGNLIVRDTFAYHGVLVVTGDVIIDPLLKVDQFVWSTDGWPLDKYGNSLRPVEGKQDESYATYEDPKFDVGTNWGYYPAASATNLVSEIRDENGDVVTIIDANGNRVPELARPLRRSEYRGELIVQGQLIVKGRIFTKAVTVDKTDESTGEKTTKTYRGVLNAFWSKDAVETTAGIWSIGENLIQRISWTNNDNINVQPIWEDRIETPGDFEK